VREAFGRRFDVVDGYLNTASIGVPPTDAADAVADAVHRWRRGTDQPARFDAEVATARAGFADLVGVPVDRVAIGASASAQVGLVAAALPDGARVLVAEDEFTSVTFPFAAQAGRGVTVTEVPLAELPDRAAGADLVAAAVVQSADGSLLDLDGLRDAVAGTGTRVLLDASQALGWLPLRLDWADAVVGVGYKWLLAPRGSCWMAVTPELRKHLVPHLANWFAGDGPWESIYGLPLRLAADARRLDTSPVWIAQVGAAVTLPWLAGLDRERVRAHCVGLADRFRLGLGEAPGDSAIAVARHPDAMARLADVGVTASVRRGAVRVGFHLYNTEADVDLALRALRG
jgi:selenocysteine lyase/cysteine desulfurase